MSLCPTVCTAGLSRQRNGAVQLCALSRWATRSSRRPVNVHRVRTWLPRAQQRLCVLFRVFSGAKTNQGRELDKLGGAHAAVQGYVTETQGQPDCAACPPGRRAPAAGLACSACEAGYYASINGSAACFACLPVRGLRSLLNTRPTREALT
jgi:hypothetical protein